MKDLEKYQFMAPGRPAPGFKLTAVKSGREVSQKDCSGYVLGLIFHDRETAQAVIDIQNLVRPEYPDTGLTLASVVDVSRVPRFLRRVARPFLEQVYDDAAKQMPADLKPEDYIFLLPDWDGKVTKSFGVKNQDKTAALVVVNRDGVVIGSYQGPEPAQAMLALVRKAMDEG
jgi:hypothetical protein